MAFEGTVPARTRRAETPSEDSVLPPGRRDHSGFWLPLAYDDARTLVRRRRRRTAGARAPERESDPGDTA